MRAVFRYFGIAASFMTKKTREAWILLYEFLKKDCGRKNSKEGLFMHTKTMEGLAGASTNMKLLSTPFRVYKDAERRGDTAVMERAMGYVGDFADKAEDYQKVTEEGMKEEAKEAREKAKTEQENAIQRRREEREEQEKRIAENRNGDTDTVSISESGKAALSEKSSSDQTGEDGNISAEKPADVVKMEPVIYTKTGEAAGPEPDAAFSVSV